MIAHLAIQTHFTKMLPWLSTFLEGTINTLVLSFLTVCFGLVLALALHAMRSSKIGIVSFLAKAYILIVRGTPLLVQLFLWLYAMPYIGLKIPAIPFLGLTYGSREFLTATLALSLNSAAYIAELLRSGVEAMDKGQMEAARSLGMSKRQSMRYVIWPQAIPIFLPGLGNEFIQMIKETSIVSTVGIFDLMYSQNIVKSATYSVFEPLLIVSAIYLILTSGLSHILKCLERKFHVTHTNSKLA